MHEHMSLCIVQFARNYPENMAIVYSFSTKINVKILLTTLSIGGTIEASETFDFY